MGFVWVLLPAGSHCGSLCSLFVVFSAHVDSRAFLVNALDVHSVSIFCSLYVHLLPIGCSLFAHWPLIVCSHCLFTLCLLVVRSQFIARPWLVMVSSRARLLDHLNATLLCMPSTSSPAMSYVGGGACADVCGWRVLAATGSCGSTSVALTLRGR